MGDIVFPRFDKSKRKKKSVSPTVYVLSADFLVTQLGLVGFEPTTPCVGNTDSRSTELQALFHRKQKKK